MDEKLRKQTKHYVMLVINHYIDSRLLDKGIFWNPMKRMTTIRQRSFSAWAAMKCREIAKASDKPVDDLMIFADRMDRYTCDAKNPDMSYAFSVAYDTVTDILSQLM